MRTRYLVVCLLLIAAVCAALWLPGPGLMALATLAGALLPRIAPRRRGLFADTL